MDIAEWLRSLGLEQYAPAFQDHGIDIRVLPQLTAEDLKDLGVGMIGHRRLLLNAIAGLRTELAAAPDVSTPGAPAAGSGAERRQLTVMFCDLVGSTALSARLDPEELRELIGAYHRGVTAAVRCFDGFVAKYMGDGVLVYFGYPRAHEDDAERAVRAGLAVVEAVRGIATGLVVVGDLVGEGASQEQAVVGETPNLATRLQASAEPGSVLIAPVTRRLLGNLFRLQARGRHEVKDFSEPSRPGRSRVWRRPRASSGAPVPYRQRGDRRPGEQITALSDNR
jgi:class 3 adenylate cyclase